MIPFACQLDCIKAHSFHVLYKVLAIFYTKLFSIGYQIAMLHAVTSIALTMTVILTPSQVGFYPRNIMPALLLARYFLYSASVAYSSVPMPDVKAEYAIKLFFKRGA
jgi:hypothetical protein